MASRRRTVEVFTLSFLDCICCGFGAVILFYTIVSAQQECRRTQHRRIERGSQSPRRSGPVRFPQPGGAAQPDRKDISETVSDEARTRSLASTLEASASSCLRLIRAASPGRADREVEGRHPLAAGRQAPPRRREPGQDAPGQQISAFRETGGDRRYITGIKLRGKRILILLDRSASMLHEDLVTILRLR